MHLLFNCSSYINLFFSLKKISNIFFSKFGAASFGKFLGQIQADEWDFSLGPAELVKAHLRDPLDRAQQRGPVAPSLFQSLVKRNLRYDTEHFKTTSSRMRCSQITHKQEENANIFPS